MVALRRVRPHAGEWTRVLMLASVPALSGGTLGAQANEPVGGVQVVLQEVGGAHRHRAVTNARGAFTIANVAPGAYRVVVTAASVQLAQQPVVGVATPTARVIVHAADLDTVIRVGITYPGNRSRPEFHYLTPTALRGGTEMLALVREPRAGGPRRGGQASGVRLAGRVSWWALARGVALPTERPLAAPWPTPRAVRTRAPRAESARTARVGATLPAAAP